MPEERLNPDELLAAIQKEERASRRGKLKVFLGMAAGAGKTYSMLEAALRNQKEGAEVLIGFVETHGRKETAALASQLPTLSRKKLLYRNIEVEEFDLEAALARHPQLILVDELAHTNVPGSRHPKRYQDIRELLHAGIDVYTTLNVQHVESRADTVEKITGSRVQETVPDSVLDEADIELIDISPQDLLLRLNEGKVYIPERAAVAMINFFREGNLTALREMALRLAAERVGQDVHDYMRVMQIQGPWKTGHRLLVAVSASPLSAQMIRWTRRLADSWDCPWIAVHVEISRPESEEDQARLTRNLDLARELGAEVITTSDTDIVRGILRIARQQNVTQIIVGKPDEKGFIGWWRRRNFLHRLVQESGDIDLHVVRAEKDEARRPARSRIRPGRIDWRAYTIALGAVLATAVVNHFVDPLIGYRALALNFLLVVVLLGMFVGRGPVFFAATLSALLWNYFFLPPHYTFYIVGFENAMMFSTYFVVALVIGHLVSRLHLQEQAERRREQRATALYLFTRDLVDATSLDQIVQKLAKHTRDVFDAESAITLAESTKRLAPAPHGASSFAMSDKEYGVAAWAFHNGKAAGKFTDNLPAAEAYHIPLATPRETLGVISVKLPSDSPMTLDQRNLLDTFARQVAVAVDRQNLQDSAERSRLSAESERLSKALLDSVSHEMRTPIAAITSSANAYFETNDATMRSSLVQEIQTAARRLNRLVANLLSATRVEAGHLKPRMEWHDPADVIQISLRNLEPELANHRVRTELASDLPLVRMDLSLTEQALNNILLNAAVHTPAASEIIVQTGATPSELTIRVLDNGPGVPEACLPHLFDKFYRVPGTHAGGTGLGLSIVKSFIETQGGQVTAANRPGGGAVFTITLPIADEPFIPEEMP